MYDYKKDPVLIDVNLLPFVDDVLDNIPVQFPYVPRLCEEQGHMLIWWGTQDTDADIADDCFSVKTEEQWITCKEHWKIEKAIVLLWPFADEVIIGAVKYPGYMRSRPQKELRRLLITVWTDVVQMFGHKKIICPTGTYLECLHLCMNQMRISHEAYHKKMMRKFDFKKDDTADFWIRNSNV